MPEYHLWFAFDFSTFPMKECSASFGGSAYEGNTSGKNLSLTSIWKTQLNADYLVLQLGHL